MGDIKLSVFVLLLLAMVQCKTSKTVTDVKFNAIEKRDVTQIIQKKNTDSSAVYVVDKSVIKDSAYEQITEYVFSTPDSVGNQFVKAVRMVSKGNEKKIAANVETVQYILTNSATDVKTIDNTKTEVKHKSSDVKKEYSSVWKRYEIIVLIIIIVLCVILYIRKKIMYGKN